MAKIFEPKKYHDEFGGADSSLDETIPNQTLRKSTREIDGDLYDYLVKLGILHNEVRNYHIGSSDYSFKIIQPWSVWIDWNLNPWDADIVKRIERKKEIPGMTETESRIEDYKKIKHICDERIRQLSL